MKLASVRARKPLLPCQDTAPEELVHLQVGVEALWLGVFRWLAADVDAV